MLKPLHMTMPQYLKEGETRHGESATSATNSPVPVSCRNVQLQVQTKSNVENNAYKEYNLPSFRDYQCTYNLMLILW